MRRQEKQHLITRNTGRAKNSAKVDDAANGKILTSLSRSDKNSFRDFVDPWRDQNHHINLTVLATSHTSRRLKYLPKFVDFF